MLRPALPLALLLLLTACDSGGPNGSDDQDGQEPPIEQGQIEQDQDDGSVAFADVYVADVSGTDASFFRADLGGSCGEASLTLRFDASRFELECLIDSANGPIRYSPSGSFGYELAERSLRVTAFGYELNGTALANGERIDGVIESPSGTTVAAEFEAQE